MAAFKDALSERGLGVGMATTNLFGHPAFKDGAFTSNDRGVRRAAIGKAMLSIDLGAELGAEVYVFWGGREGTEVGAAKDPRDALERYREAINLLADYAVDQGYDLKFAIEPKPNEPRGDMFLPTVGHALHFITTLDRPEMVGVNPEVAHETMAGLSFMHGVGQALWAGKLFHIDLNGQRIGRYDQDFRFGAEDLKEAFHLVRLLERAGYDGPRHFDAHPYRNENEEGVWDFARGCIRTYTAAGGEGPPLRLSCPRCRRRWRRPRRRSWARPRPRAWAMPMRSRPRPASSMPWRSAGTTTRRWISWWSRCCSGRDEEMSPPTTRERNALRVLDYLFREGPAPRGDVVRATSLSRATVSKLIGELQAQGLVAETGEPLTAVGRSGRPPTLLALNPELGAFGGVDFGHSSVRVAIADVSGALIAEDRQDLDVDNEAERAIAAAVEGLLALAGDAHLRRERLLGVGAAISAPVRRDGASLAAAGILPGWSAVSPQRELAHRLGLPVHVGNDANLGALAEVRTGAARGASDVVYLMLSSGVGGGLILGGSLFTGHGGMTGELGHVTVDPDGAPCRCGNRGCLETVAGAQWLLKRLGSALGETLALPEAVARARAGDAVCRRFFREAGLAAGRVAGGICNVVNPELVIVGGDLIVAGDLLVDAVREGLEQTSIPAVRADVAVVAATLGDRAELLGAIGLAIEQADIATVARAA